MAAQKVWLPNFPAACLGEKLGLKLPKYFYKMLSLLVVDSSACAGGRCVWAGCALEWCGRSRTGFPAPPLGPPSLAQGKEITLGFAVFFYLSSRKQYQCYASSVYPLRENGIFK